MVPFMVLRMKVSLGLCFRKINMTAGCRVDWKERRLELRALILLVARRERHWFSYTKGKFIGGATERDKLKIEFKEHRHAALLT